jgi:hypothetical protein
MRRRYSRAVAILMAVAAGGLAAFALRPAAGSSTAALAARNPAVEVRTQLIRRTIHVVRHEPGAAMRGVRGSTAIVAHGRGHARTTASGRDHSAGAAGHGGVAVATRTSGGHAASTSRTAGTSAPVSTRASGSHSSSSNGASLAPRRTSGRVSTRASGSHGASPSGTSPRPVTRSSGGAYAGRDDGGDSGGHDN